MKETRTGLQYAAFKPVLDGTVDTIHANMTPDRKKLMLLSVD